MEKKNGLNMKKNEYNRELEKWVYDVILNRFKEIKNEFDSADSYFKENLYFVTIMFDSKKLKIQYKNEGSSIGSLEMKQFNNFYNMICRKRLGREYNKKNNIEKPLCIVSADVNDSRYWSGFGEVKNFHLHTIWIMDENQKIAFDEVSEKTKGMQNFAFREIHTENFTKDMKTIISYTMKLDKFIREDLPIVDSFNIYPH